MKKTLKKLLEVKLHVLQEKLIESEKGVDPWSKIGEKMKEREEILKQIEKIEKRLNSERSFLGKIFG